MIFFLGTHQPAWLRTAGFPLFLSAVRLRRYKNLPRARDIWSLDSGGFSEIARHGRWTVGPRQYAEEAWRWHEGIGCLHWAAVQDWMCEPFMLARTGKTMQEHQELTVQSYLDLVALEPRIYWMPVLQGYEPDDYLRHFDMHLSAGVDLRKLPVVGLGSVCRRQHEEVDKAVAIIGQLHQLGIRLHAFGFKITGLEACGHLLNSADSMAWSREGRRYLLDGCSNHKNCANCFTYAAEWRQKVILRTKRGK